MSKAGGNCYERAFRALTEGWHDDLLEGLPDGWQGRFVLVHGFPRLTAESRGYPEGTKYGHAWLELIVAVPDVGEMRHCVVDCGCWDDSKRTIMPDFLYFRAGSIEDDECRRYEKADAMRMAVEHEHFGHWHPDDAVPEGTVHANDE